MAVTPVSLELFKNSLASIVDDMSLTIVRTAHSHAVREMMDFTTALCDWEARVVCQGLGLGLHLGTVPDVVRTVHEKFKGNLVPGDVVAVNDPYQGGTHLPDIYMIRPVFWEGDLVSYAVINMHHMDVGGRVAGSVSPNSTEIFQEGLRIGPVKIFSAGEPNETLITLLTFNSRLPDKVLGDLRAQSAACLSCERGVHQLIQKHGLPAVKEHMIGLVDYAELMARQEIAQFPDGVYHFVDHLDDNGVTDEPIRIQVELTIKGDEITVDFTGSSPQVPGALNTVIPMTRSATYCSIRAIMRSNLPNNEGFYRPITVIAPPGTVLNPNFPAAVAARGATAHRICDAVFGALGQALPDRVMAADEGGSTNLGIGGVTPEGEQFLHLEFIYGAWGGRPTMDGIEGVANIFANLANTPVEVVEAEVPFTVRQYGFVPDTGGPGKYRGGVSVMRELELHNPVASLVIRSDRRKFRPFGLQGGLPGHPSMNLLNPGPDEEILPTKYSGSMKGGDILRHTLASGGGHGDPLERDPARVVTDLEDEKITLQHATEAYGVVVDKESMKIDQRATEALRQKLRQSRLTTN